MKSERELFKHDLSEQEGSYTKAINDHMEELNVAASDYNISLAEFKQIVLAIVNEAHDTKARRNFIAKLQGMKTKENAIFYVYDAYLKGKGLEAI